MGLLFLLECWLSGNWIFQNVGYKWELDFSKCWLSGNKSEEVMDDIINSPFVFQKEKKMIKRSKIRRKGGEKMLHVYNILV